MRIHHYISRYVGKLFLSRFFFIFLVLFFSLLFIETLSSKKRLPDATLYDQMMMASLKIPLLLHKTLPFLLFGAGFLLFFRLIRYQELSAMHSSSVSLWRILSIPMVLTALIGSMDLFFLTPLSTSCFMKMHLSEKTIEPSEESWMFCQSPRQIAILNTKEKGGGLFLFTPEFFFIKQYTASSLDIQDKTILMKQVWALQPDVAPLFLKDILLPNPMQFMQCKSSHSPHPSLMSFIQTHHAIFSTPSPQKISYFRWHYLLANLLWMITLVALSGSLVIGKTTRMRRLSRVVFGSLLCLFLYLCQEWLYALGLSFSYLLSPFLLWVIPLVTGLLSILILFEKNEL